MVSFNLLKIMKNGTQVDIISNSEIFHKELMDMRDFIEGIFRFTKLGCHLGNNKIAFSELSEKNVEQMKEILKMERMKGWTLKIINPTRSEIKNCLVGDSEDKNETKCKKDEGRRKLVKMKNGWSVFQ